MSEAAPTSWRSRAVRLVGNAVAVAGIVFVALTVRRHLAALPPLQLSPSLSVSIALGVVANVVAMVLGAWTWRTLLAAAGAPISWRSSFSIVGRANLAKYLPCNVFHIVGRAGLAASEEGLKLPLVLATMTIETLMIIAIAVALGAPAAVSQLDALRAMVPAGPWLLLGALGLAVALVVVVAVVLRRRRVVVGSVALAKVAAADVVTCVLLGSSVYAFLATAFPTTTMPWSICVSGFSLAWVLGFVTPGAPGGVGVREAIFLLLAAHSTTVEHPTLAAAFSAAIAATVVVGRLQSVVADVIVFVVARAMAPAPPQGRVATIK